MTEYQYYNLQLRLNKINELGVEWRLEQYVAQLGTAVFSATKLEESGMILVAYLLAKELEYYRGPLTFNADSIEVDAVVNDDKINLKCVFKKGEHTCTFESRGLILYLSSNLQNVVKIGGRDE